MPVIAAVATTIATATGVAMTTATVISGALIGAATGAIVSAVTGGDILKGALLGGLTGAVGGALSAGSAASGAVAGTETATGALTSAGDFASLESNIASGSVAGITPTTPTTTLTELGTRMPTGGNAPAPTPPAQGGGIFDTGPGGTLNMKQQMLLKGIEKGADYFAKSGQKGDYGEAARIKAESDLRQSQQAPPSITMGPATITSNRPSARSQYNQELERLLAAITPQKATVVAPAVERPTVYRETGALA